MSNIAESIRKAFVDYEINRVSCSTSADGFNFLEIPPEILVKGQAIRPDELLRCKYCRRINAPATYGDNGVCIGCGAPL